jgi:hypothetical protein
VSIVDPKDLVSELEDGIQERMCELEPLIAEYERLMRAMAALEGSLQPLQPAPTLASTRRDQPTTRTQPRARRTVRADRASFVDLATAHTVDFTDAQAQLVRDFLTRNAA